MNEERKTPEVVRVLDRMRVLCSRREYCSADIRGKVLSALPESSPDVIEWIIASLKKDKYLDDLRYASAFARDKSAIIGWGTGKIKYALSVKKIDRPIIEAALDGIDSGKAAGKLEKVLKNKYLSLKNDPAWRTKLIRFALGRGYGYDETIAVLSTLHPSP